jgi:hypothetical protein
MKREMCNKEDKMEIDKERMNTIASYMDDELREYIHGQTEDSVDFIGIYLDYDPDFTDVLYHEFRDVYVHFFGR